MKQAIVIFPSDESLTSINLTGYVLFIQFSPLNGGISGKVERNICCRKGDEIHTKKLFVS